MLTRVPILVRLTAAFSVAMVVVLTGAGVFVALRLRIDLDDRVDENLASRLVAAERAARAAGDVSAVPVDDPHESFVQLLDASGAVVSQSGGVRGPVLNRDEVTRALAGERLRLERDLPGIEGRARIVGRPADGAAAGTLVVVGQSLVDRQEAVASVLRSFAWGGLACLLAAAGTGYLLARAGLAPVEAMRERARTIATTGSPESLPLPAAHDQIRALGETLNAMLERLREGLERERRFSADASHEIRTPLAVIRTELEGVLRGPVAGDTRAAIEAAHDEVLRLGRLAEDLLVLARLEDGEAPVRRRDVDLRPILDSVRAQYADRAAGEGRFVALEAPVTLPVSVDPDRIRQLLVNLLDNAVRHGEGTVTITAVDDPGAVELSVSDEGPGFPDDYAAVAFQRFARPEAARGNGAGLGLSLVAAIAEAHGGRAWLGPGGAEVRVRLPVASD